ncbi:MAG: 2-succinylbenzoate--CoA ligase [Microcoleaceae cyanobacterium]
MFSENELMNPPCYNNLQYFLTLPNEQWWVGTNDSKDFNQIATDKFNQFYRFYCTYDYYPQVLLVEPDPVYFLASFIAAVAANCPIFLGNPHWQELEWQQVFAQVKPDIILGEVSVKSPTVFNYNPQNLAHFIMIPTGGSSGQIKFAVHTWETLTASVQGFQQYFQRSKINSYCVLPLYHVSGLMQFIRSFTTGGKLIIQSFNQIKQGDFIETNPSNFFISLVPTQLQTLLKIPQSTLWLSQFNTVLLGGAPAGSELLTEARDHQICLAPTYGMTETASQIVTLKPIDFLAGYQNSGQVLPHAKIEINSPESQELEFNQTGSIQIKSKSLMWGYFSSSFNPKTRINQLNSDDLGYLDKQGYLTVIGRNSDKIITGGENVFPTEVEAIIRATDQVKEVCVIGLPDTYWGQIVTAVYIPKIPEVELDILKASLTGKLSKYKHPKLWIAVDKIPYNPQGKINRKQLQLWVKTLKND